MRKDFLPFSRPSISESEILAVGEVLRSGWITTGPKSQQFEKDFCNYCGCDGAVAVCSATAGMHVTFLALNIGPGDEVITPSMTWVSTVNLIVRMGAKPVFVDIDKDTLMTSAELIEPLITERTRLIIPVDFAGAAVDIQPIRNLAASRGIAVIQDAAHSVGTHYNGTSTGCTGTSIFSFHPIKNMTTGEGGMVCSDNAGLLDSIRSLKFHGLGVDAHDRKQQGRSPQAEVMVPGFKYNMPDISAVLGLGQLGRLEGFIEKRTQLAERYLELLADVDGILPLRVPLCTTRHAWNIFVVRVDCDRLRISRDTFMEELKKRNIGTGLHFRGVHTQHYYRQSMQIEPGQLPATDWNSERMCSLPLFPDMTMDDVLDVVTAIKEVLR